MHPGGKKLVNTLLALGQNAFEWTWKTSASAALLVALVFLAQRILSRWLTPRLRYTLSLLILIRLLVPLVPASPLSLQNLFRLRAAPMKSASVSIAPDPTFQEAEPAPLAGMSPGMPPGLSHVFVPHAPGRSVRMWVSLAWDGGFLCLMTLAGWRYRRCIHFIAQGQLISDPQMLELLDSARQDMGVRRPVKLVALARLSSPAVFGFWRPCVLLPESATTQLSAQELRMIFLHEMAHVRRHDVGLNFLLIAVQFLHWFNPLVWLANRWIRADRELVCDAMTMSRLAAAEHPRYGQVLLKLMDGISVETGAFPGMVPVVGSKQEIKRRLIMIKQQRHGSIGGGLATALAVAALACATFTRAQQAPADAAQQLPSLTYPIQQGVRVGEIDQQIPSNDHLMVPINEIPAPGSVEGALRSEGKHWALTHSSMVVGTYGQDMLAGRLNQPKGRGHIGKVVSLALDENGRPVAQVDFGRGYVTPINVSELSPIRFVELDFALADSLGGRLPSEEKHWERTHI
jgi:beta-lactamase regulating signal transducer with metallopeptidase domain